MEALTQTISNLVGILLGIVGVVGVGFFIYGAYLYLTASGAPHQMERGKSAMMTALAGIVLAMVAYGVVELVMDAVVGSPVDPDVPDPSNSGRRRLPADAGRRRAMREHEVPTHVQAEDKVLLGFTFPQIVAMTAVCALSYGAYRYAPVGPSEVRMGIAVLLGLAGLAAVVGKIGGRRLPLVAADLLKYRLGARLYAGPASQLARSEPPAPAQPVKTGPGPLSLMAKKARRALGGLRRKRGSRERKGGRAPFRPHRWFGKPKRTETDRDSINGNGNSSGNGAGGRKTRRGKKPPKSFLAVAAAVVLAAAAVTVPQAVLADGHEDGEGWSSDEIEFQPPQTVEGRRLFVEGLSLTGDRAAVCGPDLDVRVRAFGGPQGASLRFWGSASLAEGERIDYSLPLDGPAPSLTFSWVDTLGQAGAVTVEGEQIPYPLPAFDGELCDLRVVSFAWTPGAVEGVVESECVAGIEHPVELQTVAGHESVTVTALMDADVTGVAGTVTVAGGGRRASATFTPNGETRFRLPVETGEAVHAVTIEAALEAGLRIPVPPLTQLTHHPEWTEHITKTVHLHRPGASDSDSDTATATCDDGSSSSATATAYAYVPSATIAKDVTVDVLHKEHVKAEMIDRAPIAETRNESLSLASNVWSDDPFEVLVLPEPEPVDPPAEQTPADGGLRDWFEALGWEWPW